MIIQSRGGGGGGEGGDNVEEEDDDGTIDRVLWAYQKKEARHIIGLSKSSLGQEFREQQTKRQQTKRQQTTFEPLDLHVGVDARTHAFARTERLCVLCFCCGQAAQRIAAFLIIKS
jgi:hypothetical protein